MMYSNDVALCESTLCKCKLVLEGCAGCTISEPALALALFTVVEKGYM